MVAGTVVMRQGVRMVWSEIVLVWGHVGWSVVGVCVGYPCGKFFINLERLKRRR